MDYKSLIDLDNNSLRCYRTIKDMRKRRTYHREGDMFFVKEGSSFYRYENGSYDLKHSYESVMAAFGSQVGSYSPTSFKKDSVTYFDGYFYRSLKDSNTFTPNIKNDWEIVGAGQQITKMYHTRLLEARSSETVYWNDYELVLPQTEEMTIRVKTEFAPEQKTDGTRIKISDNSKKYPTLTQTVFTEYYSDLMEHILEVDSEIVKTPELVFVVKESEVVDNVSEFSFILKVTEDFIPTNVVLVTNDGIEESVHITGPDVEELLEGTEVVLDKYYLLTENTPSSIDLRNHISPLGELDFNYFTDLKTNVFKPLNPGTVGSDILIDGQYMFGTMFPTF